MNAVVVHVCSFWDVIEVRINYKVDKINLEKLHSESQRTSPRVPWDPEQSLRLGFLDLVLLVSCLLTTWRSNKKI